MLNRLNTFRVNDTFIEEQFSAEPVVIGVWFLLLTILTVFLWIVPIAGSVVCLLMAVYALRGTRQYIEMLALLAFLLILGKGDISLGRWIVLLAAALRMLYETFRYNQPMPRIINYLLLFSIAVFVLSFIVSPFPTISIFKLISFTIGVGTVLIGFYRTRHLSDYWFSCLFTLGIFILFASLPLYGSVLGYLRNGIGFQGILTHPQTFGPVLAPMTALFAGLYLFRNHRSYVIFSGIFLGIMGMLVS